ncbi:ATP-binding protein [Okeania sp. KiyG1]|uniref:sensor histidine kinase n=1 Tax=Okeania sp. KiyG1 TaxID=2720165 RepID=UPI0027D9CFE4|nr:ATP-binding protein [Okeania sp. KiyG1]
MVEQAINPQQDPFTADKKRVKQILVNLVSNGIKFTPSGGSVILKVTRDKDTAIFQVEDTGIGISEEQNHYYLRNFNN